MEYKNRGYNFTYDVDADDVIIIKDGNVTRINREALISFVVECHVKPIARGLLKEVYEDFICRHGHFVNNYA